MVVQGYSETKRTPFGYRPFSNSLYFNASRVNESVILEFYPLLLKKPPKIIMGYARPIANIFKTLKRNNLEFPEVESVINYGENLREETITFLKESLNCEVLDLCSHTENAMMIHSFKDGSMRLIEDYFYGEIIDTNGNSISKGSGELIGTSFYNYAMPLIRYKTRDIVNLIDKGKNNHPFRMLRSIEGRMHDMIVLPDGSQVFLAEGAIGYAKGIIASQFIQEQPGVLIVQVVADKDFKEEYFKDIEKGLVLRLGNTMKYDFRIVDKLDHQGSGKVPFLINRMR
jgi:phenylacetate-CoA ligase